MTPHASCAVALASIAVAGLAGGPAAAAPASAAPPTVAPAAAAPGAATGIVPARWRPGERRRYRLGFHAVLTPEGAGEAIELGWTGRLALIALDVGGGRTALAAEFTGRAETNQGARVRAELDAGLREPWFAVIADDGRALEVGITARTPSAVASAWRSLLGELQFVGATGAATSWTVDEDDPTGRYHASYAPAGAPASWRKTRSDYTALHPRAGTPADPPSYRVEAADTVFQFDAASRPAGVDVHDRVVTRSQPPIPVFTADTRISLALEAADTAPRPAIAALERARAGARLASLASGPDERMQRDELDRGALARVSVPELFAQLDAGPPSDAPSRERRARVDRLLGALLRQQPARTREIERRAAAARPDRDALREVLRDAGTPEAQAALLRLARLPVLPAHDRGAAVQALGLVRHPTGETLAQLERLLDDPALGVQARFSLASAALHLRPADPARANRAVDALRSRLAHAATPRDELDAVRALGNAGDPRTLDELERRLRAPRSELRDAAAWSLRSIASPRAEDLLVELAAGDDAARAAAVRTLAFRPLTGRSERTLAALLRSDPSPQVRDGVLRATPHLLRRSAALRDAFAWCSSHDALPQLRDAASRALGALTSLAAAP